MPVTNEKLVKKITESLDLLSSSISAAAQTAATATTSSTTQLMSALSGLSIGGGEQISAPPRGCFKITNIYINAAGKLEIIYDDTPTG